MFILGLQGSPRKKGNTHDLLSLFMDEAKNQGAETQTIEPHTMDIQPCRELIVCEKKGFCPIKDEMETGVYPLIKRADLIVLASPVFFYNFPAQIKALMDRCQMFWGRKYKLNLKEPNAKNRQGFLLSCGASAGKKLFDGLELTAKVFFDAVSAKYRGALTFRHIESPGQLLSHPNVEKDVQQAVHDMVCSYTARKTILFVSKHDACLGQMAGGFFRFLAPDHFQVYTAGMDPKPEILSLTMETMAASHLDLKYLKPLPAANVNPPFDRVVYLDRESECLRIPAKESIFWKILRPIDPSRDTLERLKQDIQARVKALIDQQLP